MKPGETKSPNIRRPKVLGMTREKSDSLKEHKRVNKAEHLTAEEWNELIRNFWVKYRGYGKNINIASYIAQRGVEI